MHSGKRPDKSACIGCVSSTTALYPDTYLDINIDTYVDIYAYMCMLESMSSIRALRPDA